MFTTKKKTKANLLDFIRSLENPSEAEMLFIYGENDIILGMVLGVSQNELSRAQLHASKAKAKPFILAVAPAGEVATRVSRSIQEMTAVNVFKFTTPEEEATIKAMAKNARLRMKEADLGWDA